MRKILVVTALCLAALSGRAQEKVMNIQKTDGTCTQTRVAELSQISFLTIEEGGKGLLVKTLGGETTCVLFETNPVVTISSGKLVVTPKDTDAVQFEIGDIAEIQFGDAPDPTGIAKPRDLDMVLQGDGALLRGIPQGTEPRIYTLDGRSLPTPALSNGKLRLNRATLGAGIFIVKAGTFTAKVKL